MAPIEPAAITAAALLATKALEALGGKAGETTWAGMSRLVALIRSRVAGHRQAETALAQIERHPDGHEHVRELAELLTTFAAQDAGFHRDLVALVADARRDPTIGPLAAQVYGQAQVGQLLTIGRMRDVHFHAVPASRLVSAAPPLPIEVRWPTPGRTVTNLPLRNPTFTGRKELLDRLHESLHPGQATAVVQVRAQAVHGLGGIGKTQLVLEYAYQHTSAYDLIWWVTAEPPAAIPGQLVGLARRLGIPEYAEQAETVAVLLDELRHHDRWLVIFDNAEHPEDLRAYWPSAGGGHVLVTSRNPAWGRLAATVQVDVLRRPESMAFLQRRTALDPQEADALADALADLPLALEQAAAYLDETGTPCSEYLDLLRDRSLELFALGRPGDSRQTIATTWTVSLDRIKTQAPVAEDLLALCAFLAPEDVPRDLLAKHPDRLPDPLAAAVRDRVRFQQALGALRRYSLATVTPKAVSVHRLVQAVVRNSLGIQQARAWAATAVKVVLAGFPGQADDVRVWSEAARLLPHALIATRHVRALGAAPEATAALMYEAGRYLRARAEHIQAKTLHEHALALRESHFGPNHPETATSLNGLGNVLRDLGDLQGARTRLERALAIRETHLGPNNLHTASTLENLAQVLHDQGDLPAARNLHERALGIREAQLGPDDLRIAMSLDTLALVLRDQGRLGRARAFHERALFIRTAHLGGDHPDTATSLNNLAHVLRDQGALADARALWERALAIREVSLGPDHTRTASTLHNLAQVLHDQGDFNQARTLHERALGIRETRLGADHPRTAQSLKSLASVLHSQGDLDGARMLLERALAINEVQLDTEHPYTADIVEGIAKVVHTQGDLDTACTLHERVLAIREARLGPDHIYTADSLTNLAAVLHDQGDLNRARLLHERALEIREARLGPDHQNTVSSREALAAVRAQLENHL